MQLAFASMLGERPELKSSGEEDSWSYVDDEDDEDYKVVGEKADMKMESEKKQRRGRRRGCRKQKKKQKEEDDDGENLTAGDVFALEIELDRENKKMMKVRRGG